MTVSLVLPVLLLLVSIAMILRDLDFFLVESAFALEEKQPPTRWLAVIPRGLYSGIRRLRGPNRPLTHYFQLLAEARWFTDPVAVKNAEAWVKAALAIKPRFEDHREELLKAYHRVLGNEVVNRFTAWELLGFRHENPCTEFDVSGVLGLKLWLGFCYRDPGRMNWLARSSGSNISAEDMATEQKLLAYYPLASSSARISKFLGDLLLENPLLIPTMVRKGNLKEALQFNHDNLLTSFHSEWYFENLRCELNPSMFVPAMEDFLESVHDHTVIGLLHHHGSTED